jgi:hypothetical protein
VQPCTHPSQHQGDPAGLLARYDAMLADESLDAISDGARVTRGAVA